MILILEEFVFKRKIIYFRKNSYHSCSTVPIGVPGGEETSRICRQHGKQHEVHLRGRCKWIIVLSAISRIFISKGLLTPQQIRVQHSVVSSAKNNCRPEESCILYLFRVSHPVMTSNHSTCCLTKMESNWNKKDGNKQIGSKCEWLRAQMTLAFSPNSSYIYTI